MERTYRLSGTFEPFQDHSFIFIIKKQSRFELNEQLPVARPSEYQLNQRSKPSKHSVMNIHKLKLTRPVGPETCAK